MSSPLLSLVIAVLLLGVGWLSAHAATFYVSTAGADSVTCAQAQNAQTPRRTINQGIACLAGGDTLIVKPGEYDELLADYAGVPHAAGVTRPIPGGTASQPTVIRGASPGTAILTSSVENRGCASLVCLTRVQHLLFQDLILDGTWTHENVVGFGEPPAVFPAYLRFQHVEVRNGKGQGFNGKTDQLQLLHVDIHHNGWRHGQTTCGIDGNNFCWQYPDVYAAQACHGYCHGIYAHGDGWLIEGGRVYDNDAYGIHLYHGPTTNTTVRNVTAYNNHKGWGIGLINGSQNAVYNNVVYNNAGGGIWIKTSQTLVVHNTVVGNKGGIAIARPGATVTNNILAGNAEFGVLAHESGSGTLENNLLGGGTDIQEDAPGMLTKANNRSGDPKFVNPPSDFHLQSGSPAIAAGVYPPDAVMLTDKDGVARPFTGAVDVGAYQYSSGGPMLPAPSNLRAVVQ